MKLEKEHRLKRVYGKEIERLLEEKKNSQIDSFGSLAPLQEFFRICVALSTRLGGPRLLKKLSAGCLNVVGFGYREIK